MKIFSKRLWLLKLLLNKSWYLILQDKLLLWMTTIVYIYIELNLNFSKLIICYRIRYQFCRTSSIVLGNLLSLLLFSDK